MINMVNMVYMVNMINMVILVNMVSMVSMVNMINMVNMVNMIKLGYMVIVLNMVHYNFEICFFLFHLPMKTTKMAGARLPVLLMAAEERS